MGCVCGLSAVTSQCLCNRGGGQVLQPGGGLDVVTWQVLPLKASSHLMLSALVLHSRPVPFSSRLFPFPGVLHQFNPPLFCICQRDVRQLKEKISEQEPKTLQGFSLSAIERL